MDDFFSIHFPTLKGEIGFLPKEQLELSMDLPFLEDPELDELLQKVEGQFSLLLRERFGYDKPLILSLHQK